MIYGAIQLCLSVYMAEVTIFSSKKFILLNTDLIFVI